MKNAQKKLAELENYLQKNQANDIYNRHLINQCLIFSQQLKEILQNDENLLYLFFQSGN